ncbi:hypothetical protein ABEB36_001980 [Hypothenemus hampei]|uniref:Choline transporter-like protein n=1 Tax=Hypothenemus hampei TaxID=57062 RepID=A0ABD1FJV2_HYPHA
MGVIFAKIHPLQLEDFQKSNPSITTHLDSNLPIRIRKPTDVCFLTVFAIYLTGLSSLFAYCIYHGDFGRVVNGYDNCGTVCERNPRHLPELMSCYDTINQATFGSYHLVIYREAQSKLYDRVCTNNCSNYEGYKTFFNRCLPTNRRTVLDKFFTKTGLKDFFVEVSEDFEIYWKNFIYLCGISLAISLGFLLLFPFLAGLLVWIILIGTVVVCVTVSICLWITWKELNDFQQLDSEIQKREVWTFLGLAIVATVVSVAVILVIFVMTKRVKLVIQLFNEAGKAISSIPLLLFQPFQTFLLIIVTLSLWIYFCLWISSSGYLTEKRPNVYYYRKDFLMETTKFLNLFAMLWTVQFVIGCQHMVIAGAVVKWYFSKSKSSIDSPIIQSMYYLSRYHLGTVAIGSFWLTLVQFLRVLTAWLQKKLKKTRNGRCLTFCHCFMWILERTLNILNRNAYIITAMYGHSFYKAGKQAFNHLASNPLQVAAINSVGDFVLFLSKVLVVACTVAIGSYLLKSKEGIRYVWVPLVFIALFSYFISHCFMTVYEMTIDTIFLCFCEDCQMNDGVSRPYSMSRGLMEFVENSKHTLEKRNNHADLSNNTQTKGLDSPRSIK